MAKTDLIKAIFSFIEKHFFKFLLLVVVVLLILKLTIDVDCKNGNCELKEVGLKKGSGLHELTKKEHESKNKEQK